MSQIKFTPERIKEIVNLVKANPHIKQLHFTADGHYHVNAYSYTKEGETVPKLYSRVGMLHTAGSPVEAVLDQFLIIETATREEILEAEEEDSEGGEEEKEPAPEKKVELKLAAPVIPAAEIKEPAKAPAAGDTGEGSNTEETQN